MDLHQRARIAYRSKGNLAVPVYRNMGLGASAAKTIVGVDVHVRLDRNVIMDEGGATRGKP